MQRGSPLGEEAAKKNNKRGSIGAEDPEKGPSESQEPTIALSSVHPSGESQSELRPGTEQELEPTLSTENKKQEGGPTSQGSSRSADFQQSPENQAAAAAAATRWRTLAEASHGTAEEETPRGAQTKKTKEGVKSEATAPQGGASGRAKEEAKVQRVVTDGIESKRTGLERAQTKANSRNGVEQAIVKGVTNEETSIADGMSDGYKSEGHRPKELNMITKTEEEGAEPGSPTSQLDTQEDATKEAAAPKHSSLSRAARKVALEETTVEDSDSLKGVKSREASSSRSWQQRIRPRRSSVERTRSRISSADIARSRASSFEMSRLRGPTLEMNMFVWDTTRRSRRSGTASEEDIARNSTLDPRMFSTRQPSAARSEIRMSAQPEEQEAAAQERRPSGQVSSERPHADSITQYFRVIEKQRKEMQLQEKKEKEMAELEAAEGASDTKSAEDPDKHIRHLKCCCCLSLRVGSLLTCVLCMVGDVLLVVAGAHFFDDTSPLRAHVVGVVVILLGIMDTVVSGVALAGVLLRAWTWVEPWCLPAGRSCWPPSPTAASGLSSSTCASSTTWTMMLSSSRP